MKFILRKYFTITLSVFSLTQIIYSISISGGWKSFLYSCLILTILVYIGKPVANLIMLPINILTLNLFSWIINILIFYIWTLLETNVRISSFQSSGFLVGPLRISAFGLANWQVIIVGGILLTFLTQFFNWIMK
ncbi:phage holin family protein [Patescibacteria group bacterium]|nr:phage holin family protein [Patescibacteria group bacterium]MCL5797766.1 phage holin family protein [Patescibacteria group bacterium]